MQQQHNGRGLSPRLRQTLCDIADLTGKADAGRIGHPHNLVTPSLMTDSLSGLLAVSSGGLRPCPGVMEKEQELLAWLIRLWGGSCEGGHAGLVGSGGDECTMRAIRLGRDRLTDAVLLHSADAPGSVSAAAGLLRIEVAEVASNPAGDISLDALVDTLRDIGGRPVILALSCGTPMKGAHDDIAGAIDVLESAGIGPDRRHVHVDGVLGAMVLPFLPEAPAAITPDFGMAIDSIAIAGDQMIGAPMPCGVLVARQALLTAFGGGPARGGPHHPHAVLALWARLMSHGLAGFSRDALHGTLRARRLARTLADAGVAVLRNPFSLTVAFPAPDNDITASYQLPCQAGLAHAIIMPSVTDSLIDRFAADYVGWFRIKEAA